jgi:hypothetical protein
MLMSFDDFLAMKVVIAFRRLNNNSILYILILSCLILSTIETHGMVLFCILHFSGHMLSMSQSHSQKKTWFLQHADTLHLSNFCSAHTWFKF